MTFCTILLLSFSKDIGPCGTYGSEHDSWKNRGAVSVLSLITDVETKHFIDAGK